MKISMNSKAPFKIKGLFFMFYASDCVKMTSFFCVKDKMPQLYFSMG